MITALFLAQRRGWPKVSAWRWLAAVAVIAACDVTIAALLGAFSGRARA